MTKEIIKPKLKEPKIKDIVEEVKIEEPVVEEKSYGRGGYRRPIRKTPEEMMEEHLGGWIPKTSLGKKVRERQIKSIDEILDKKLKILEPEIVDSLIKLESELLFAGQAKGKFGGGKRTYRTWSWKSKGNSSCKRKSLEKSKVKYYPSEKGKWKFRWGF